MTKKATINISFLLIELIASFLIDWWLWVGQPQTYPFVGIMQASHITIITMILLFTVPFVSSTLFFFKKNYKSMGQSFLCLVLMLMLTSTILGR